MADQPAHWHDDPNAPQIFAQAVSGFAIQQGNVTLTFETVRFNHFLSDCPSMRVTAGRLTLPLQAAQSLVLELNNALARAGHEPAAAARVGLSMQ